jgi:cGMP-dependent protein kinase
MSFEDKLLLLNNKKSLPYFDKGIAKYKPLTYLKDNDFFGEIALIFHTTRTASIIAAEDCHLVYLSSDDYKNVFGDDIINLMNKSEYITRLFPALDKKMILKFCYMLEEKTYAHGEYIYREGMDPDSMYIIKKGEVEV